MPESGEITITPLGQHAVVHIKNHAPESALVGPPGFGSEVHVLTLAPGEWLAVAQRLSEEALRGLLAALASADVFSFVEISSGMNSVRVAGPRARELRSKGC